ncbi:ATP-dependent DNA ligase [Caulobacter segnis]|uniref:ATP-dependent DNA ligase n=1 Tax=Caulobacter segnis TaxID=88688 RepID=UPI002410A504|nr:ATP-dependent DNA ligase [Caulobacter segnis]MDG2520353.1 ATP-dependent DNA ligase [Caulobacter segnis]
MPAHPDTLRPMEARPAPQLPSTDGWWYEPKWDGFRCLAFRQGAQIDLRAKSGKPLGRYFPEIMAVLAALPFDRFILDGELIVEVNGETSFAALQMRLHPAPSRIRRLAAETPARYMLFDLLLDPQGGELLNAPRRDRARRLAALLQGTDSRQLALTPGTADLACAQAWLDAGDIEGVIAKRDDGPYAPGERAMVKVKRLRTADCVVGGFRYDRAGATVASLLLGLYDEDGRLNHVGFTSGLAAADKPALTRRLEALRGGPGFTGDAPGGRSRWSDERSAAWEPLRPELVVEVAFDHVSEARFRHGTRLVRFRPDKSPRQCRCEQLQA